MGNYYQPFSLRVSDQLLKKIQIIASTNKRSTNKELEHIIESYVENYEKENGKLNTQI